MSRDDDYPIKDPGAPEWLSNWAALHGAAIQWRTRSNDLSVGARWLVYLRLKNPPRDGHWYSRTPVQDRPDVRRSQGSLIWSVRCQWNWGLHDFMRHVADRGLLSAEEL